MCPGKPRDYNEPLEGIEWIEHIKRAESRNDLLNKAPTLTFVMRIAAGWTDSPSVFSVRTIAWKAFSANVPERAFFCGSVCKQLGLDIGKGLEFQCVAAGVFKEHGVLFASLPFKTNVRFDDKVVDECANTISQLLPRFDIQYHTKMWYRDGVFVNRIAVVRHFTIGSKIRIQVGDNLMPKHIEVDPLRVASAFGQTHLNAVKFASFMNVAYLKRNVKWSEHGAKPFCIVRQNSGGLSND